MDYGCGYDVKQTFVKYLTIF